MVYFIDWKPVKEMTYCLHSVKNSFKLLPTYTEHTEYTFRVDSGGHIYETGLMQL